MLYEDLNDCDSCWQNSKSVAMSPERHSKTADRPSMLVDSWGGILNVFIQSFSMVFIELHIYPAFFPNLCVVRNINVFSMVKVKKQHFILMLW